MAVRWRSIVWCTVIAVLAGLTAASPALAIGGVPSISGYVSRVDLGTAAGVTVMAFSPSGSGWIPCATAVVDPTDYFEFPSLAAGTYRVGIVAYSRDSAGHFYDDCYAPAASSVATATDIVVTSGVESYADIDAVDLSAAYSVYVYDGVTGQALRNATAELLVPEGLGYRTLATVTTDVNGGCKLPGQLGQAFSVKASSPGCSSQIRAMSVYTGSRRSITFTLGPPETAPPSLRCVVSGWTFSVTSTDNAGPPVITYSLNGGAPQRYARPVTLTVPDDYTVQVTSTDISGNATSDTFNVYVHPRTTTARIAGSTRYDVAVNMARTMRPSMMFTDVVVVCGEDRAMADPLGAASLASAYDCPVLLTPTAKANASTLGAIKAMCAANGGRINIHVVGGAASIPKEVYNAYAKARGAGTIERISGKNRYALAYQIAARVKAVSESKGLAIPGVIVANIESSASFNDVLAVSSASAYAHLPIIGVKGGAVPSEAQAALALFPGKPRYALNSAYLSAGVRSATGSTEVVTAHTNRVEASIAIAQWARFHGYTRYRYMCLVNKLSDALPAGALVGSRYGVLLYTTATSMPRATKTFVISSGRQIWQGWLLGGSASVGGSNMTDMSNAFSGVY